MNGESKRENRGRLAGLSAGLALGLCCCVAWVAGCSRDHYRKSADKEAYEIIRSRGPKVPNMETNFTIETNAIVSFQDLPQVQSVDETLGVAGTNEVGCYLLPLDRALKIAVKNSRAYQTRKETLYLEALNLSLIRHRYTPIFNGSGSAFWRRSAQEGVDGLVENQSVEVSGGVGLNKLMSTGARLATDFTVDFQRFFLGGPSTVTSSRLGASLTQPLLRGRGYRVTMENLTQGERNLLYALREFVRYRKDFAVQIASTYYGVLRNRDAVKNSYLGWQAAAKNEKKSLATFRVGRTRKADLGRYQQALIDSESSWLSSIRTYQQALDNFKLTLGLPTDTRLALDSQELSVLKIQHPSVTAEEAIRVALVSRLDFYNTRERFEDAARKVDLAGNDLLPDLDLVLQANVPSQPGNGIPELDFEKTQLSGGVNFDPGLDRKAERNSYRSSLISYDRARRDLEEQVDNIKLQVLDSWRRLDEARRQYGSSELSVKLTESRVREQELLGRLGRANSEEVVSAQNDLTRSRNQLTTQLINHVINRLSLWRDMGILMIQEDGRWEEITDVKPN